MCNSQLTWCEWVGKAIVITMLMKYDQFNTIKSFWKHFYSLQSFQILDLCSSAHRFVFNDIWSIIVINSSLDIH